MDFAYVFSIIELIWLSLRLHKNKEVFKNERIDIKHVASNSDGWWP